MRGVFVQRKEEIDWTPLRQEVETYNHTSKQARPVPKWEILLVKIPREIIHIITILLQSMYINMWEW